MGQVIGSPGSGTLTAFYPGDTQSGSTVQNNGDWGQGAGGWGFTGYGNAGGAAGAMGFGGGSNTTTGTQSQTGSSSGGSSGTNNGTTTNTQSAMDPALWSAFSGGLQNAIAHPGTPDSVTQGIINKGTDQLSEAQKASAIELNNRAQAMGAGQSGGLQGAMGALDASYAGQKSNLARDAELAAEQTRQDRELQALNIASHEPMNTTGTTQGATTNNYYGNTSSSGTDSQTAPTQPTSYGSYGSGAQALGFGNYGASAPNALQTAGMSKATSVFPSFSVQGKSGGSSGGSAGFGQGIPGAPSGMLPDDPYSRGNGSYDPSQDYRSQNGNYTYGNNQLYGAR